MAEQRLLVNLKIKKDMYRQWKQAWVAWGENSSAIQTCRDEIRKAEVQVEMNLVKDVKNNKEIL